MAFIPISWLPKKNVTNQIVLITGAGSGLGRLMAIKFYELGARVVMWDINEPGLEETMKLIKKCENYSIDRPAYFYKINLANKDDIYSLAKVVQNDVGKVNILVNNAGIVSGQLFLDIPDNSIDLTFKVNVMAHFYMIKAFLPDMIQRKEGHIVTIASVAGIYGVSFLSDYCSSKFANVGMNWSLRMELDQAGLENIKTTIIKPYFIDTGMFKGVSTGVFSLLDQNDVANHIMNSILTNQYDISIPGFFNPLIALLLWVPSKCWKPVYDFIGGYDLMALFIGRK